VQCFEMFSVQTKILSLSLCPFANFIFETNELVWIKFSIGNLQRMLNKFSVRSVGITDRRKFKSMFLG
jgi:hypothetical protein